MALGPTLSYTVLNDLGQAIGGGSGIPRVGGGAWNKIFGDAINAGKTDLAGRVSGLVDPITGQPLRAPRSAAEAAEMQDAMNKIAAQKANDARGQALGLLGGAGSGGAFGTSQPDPYFDKIKRAYSTGLTGFLEHPGLDPAEVEGIINKGTEEITTGQKDSERRLRDLAAAQGFSEGGSRLAGEQDFLSDYSGQRANLARDVRLGAAKDRSRLGLAALGTAGNYLGRAEDSARSDRNKMISFLMNQKFQTPDYSNLINSGLNPVPGLSNGYGGGNVPRQTRAPAALPGFGQPFAGGGGGGGGGGNPPPAPNQAPAPAPAPNPAPAQAQARPSTAPAGSRTRVTTPAPTTRNTGAPRNYPGAMKGPLTGKPLVPGQKYKWNQATGRMEPVQDPLKVGIAGFGVPFTGRDYTKPKRRYGGAGGSGFGGTMSKYGFGTLSGFGGGSYGTKSGGGAGGGLQSLAMSA